MSLDCVPKYKNLGDLDSVLYIDTNRYMDPAPEGSATLYLYLYPISITFTKTTFNSLPIKKHPTMGS